MAEEILEDLFFIERGYLNCNHFVYKSPAPVLIDSGYIGDFGETESLIKKLGVSLADVALIIGTHTHCDHIGGNHFIQQKSGCDIALHKFGKHFMDTKDDWATWWKYYEQEAEFFQCTHSLDDGDILWVGPHEFEVIYTPGHAADGIVLYNRKAKILISSDTLWEKDTSVMTLRVEGSTALFQRLDVLSRLEALEVEKVYPGHGQPFSDMHTALARTRQKIQDCVYDRELLGNDLLKKLIIYTLLIKKTVRENEFFSYLMKTRWFRETIDLYFNGEYLGKYQEIIDSFITRGIVQREKDSFYTTIKP